jgi:hypothetical protein
LGVDIGIVHATGISRFAWPRKAVIAPPGARP